MFYPPPSAKPGKRRPGTANKRNLKVPKGFSSVHHVGPISAKAGAMDAQISKMRPIRVNQERERLYDDVMKQRMTTNVLKEENTRLKTRLYFIENELAKKDKIIDELVIQQEN
jgi:hypothetical protein